MLKDLNPEQLKAVEVIDKPLIIIAGPGTGKTKTLVSKVEYLIKTKNFSPTKIAVLTFTDKAARELKERFVLVDVGILGFVGTFHALAYKQLSKFKKIQLISPEQKREELGLLLNNSEFKELSLREAELIISNIKNGINLPHFQKLYSVYCARLKALELMDFDDLLLEFKEFLLKETCYPDSIFEFIFVDEFQDTNLIQYEILKELVKISGYTMENSKVFVIGDPLQAIYGFRGADQDIFTRFKADFKTFRELTLNTNYRSTCEIIDAAHSLFPHSPVLKSASAEQGTVKLITTANEYTEADYVLREICKKVGGTNLVQSSEMDFDQDQGCNFSDFAVIYRTHFLSKILKKEFQESGIPYQIVGEGNIYESKEFNFFYNVLSYIFLNNDNTLVQILLSKPVRIEHTLIEDLLRDPGITLKQRIQTAIDQKELFAKVRKKLWNLLLKLDMLKLASVDLPLSKLCRLVVKEFNLSDRITSEIKRWEFHELINSILRFDDLGTDAFSKYVKYVENLKINEGYASADKVTLMTLHASKGLEFKYVFICGFEENIIPFKKAVREGSIEEEKRLLYVGMTRAKKYLNLITVKTRHNEKQLPSQFQELLQRSRSVNKATDSFVEKLELRKAKQKQKLSQMKMF